MALLKTNMGKEDRIIRVILAATIGVLYLTNVISGTLAIILMILGIIFLATAAMATCPLYLPFGLSTIRKKIYNSTVKI